MSAADEYFPVLFYVALCRSQEYNMTRIIRKYWKETCILYCCKAIKVVRVKECGEAGIAHISAYFLPHLLSRYILY